MHCRATQSDPFLVFRSLTCVLSFHATRTTTPQVHPMRATEHVRHVDGGCQHVHRVVLHHRSPCYREDGNACRGRRLLDQVCRSGCARVQEVLHDDHLSFSLSLSLSLSLSHTHTHTHTHTLVETSIAADFCKQILFTDSLIPSVD